MVQRRSARAVSLALLVVWLGVVGLVAVAGPVGAADRGGIARPAPLPLGPPAVEPGGDWPGADSAQAAGQPAIAFERAPCMFKPPEGAAIGSDVECGYLRVPLRHADPAGPTIRLAVAIFKRTGSGGSPAAGPLVMAQGGPGGSTLEAYAAPLLKAEGLMAKLRAAWDVVLFDQRGTLHSEPALLCPEVIDNMTRTLELRLSPAEQIERDAQATLACGRRLAGSGIDLGAFNSLENAADIDALRQALGYPQINLYGVSYGTFLALQTLRGYPAGLRSVILDAVVPPQVNWLAEGPRQNQRGLNELFRACAEAAACNAAYPNLEGVFFELVARLDREPLRVPITDPETKRRYRAVLDGAGLADGLAQFLYVSDAIPALPRAIYDLRAGRTDLFEVLWPQLLFKRDMATGFYYSVVCAEETDPRTREPDLTGLWPVFADRAPIQARGIETICAGWNVPPLWPAIDQPVTGDVPTLLLSGRFDPITPPAYADLVAATLRRHVAYTVPNSGHGAFLAQGCATDIVLAFLANPEGTPDGSCLAGEARVAFLTPDAVLTVPGWIKQRRLVEAGELAPLGPIVLAWLALASFVIVWPVGSLVRRLRRRPATTGRAARWAPWLALLTALTATAILAVFFAFPAMFLAPGIGALYGFAPSAAPILALPWLAGLLALLLAFAAVQAWRERAWAVPARLYFSLVALAALALAVSLLDFMFVPA